MSKSRMSDYEESNKQITISIPQGWADNHINLIASKIMGSCVGLMIPYDVKRFELIQHRIESIIYSYIEEAPSERKYKP